jgi:putative phosphotransacetylase
VRPPSAEGLADHVRVLGQPARYQLEISRADCFTLGIKAPVRESGQLENAGSALLIGPAGHVELRSGDLRLAAYPYVAAGCAAAERRQWPEGQRPQRRTPADLRVVVRVRDDFALEFHMIPKKPTPPD